jgi:hypothetical protein
MNTTSVEPGSFRDRTNRIFYRDGSVLRGLRGRALAEWEALSSTKFFDRLLREGKVVPTMRLGGGGLQNADELASWAAVLRHERIPFVSYPYEWCFGMLKDAALLQLELLDAALEEGMILKDATPFNCQWIGSRPVFIDVASFERLPPGEPWAAYRQFCEMFLYPLLLQAYREIPFHAWLRGHIDGVEAEHCMNLMSARDLLRPGVLTHVYLQAKAQSRYARSNADIKADLRTAGFHTQLITANVRRLRRLLERLTWKTARSTWSDYVSANSYTDLDREEKAAFVRDVVWSRRWRLVWDLGCNTGTFSRIAAENADQVVAMDADHLAIEHLYQRLKREGQQTILPLVSNLADPSPRLGWRGTERGTLADRGRPSLTLCLALIHHVAITANIPIADFVDWLRSLGTCLVIEFVTRDDPMVRTLLRNKRDDYDDYNRDHFERCLEDGFNIERCVQLACGTRVLYHCSPPAN